jgi:glutathione S-transferase
MASVPRLITFQISHYCEKARWAFDRTGLPYVEECHLPLLHRLKTVPLRGRSVPVLITETDIFTDSADILKHVDTFAPAHLKLYPESTALRTEVEELEAKFDRQLGVLIRQWGYFYALQKPGLTQGLWCEGVPTWEKLLAPITFPITRRIVCSSYNVNRDSAVAAYQRIQKMFQTVSDRLADGRKYLVGDAFSAADLTFASLAAPGLVPPEYGGISSALDQRPDEMVEQIQILRDTVAGQHALRLYREERHLNKP